MIPVVRVDLAQSQYSQDRVLYELQQARKKLRQLELFSIQQRQRIDQLNQLNLGFSRQLSNSKDSRQQIEQNQRIKSHLLNDLNQAVCMNQSLLDEIKKIKQEPPSFQGLVQLASRIKDSCVRIHKLQIKPLTAVHTLQFHNPTRQKSSQNSTQPLQHFSESLRIYPELPKSVNRIERVHYKPEFQFIGQMGRKEDSLFVKSRQPQRQSQIPQRISLIYNKSNEDDLNERFRKTDVFIQNEQEVRYMEQCHNPYLFNQQNLRASAFSSRSKASNLSRISQKSNKSVLSKLSRGVVRCQINNPYLQKQQPRQISEVIERLYNQMGSLLQRSERVFSSMKNDAAKINLDYE